MSSKKVALVVGGTSGYGAGIAAMLEARGYQVEAVGRSSTPALDVTDNVSVNSFFEWFWQKYAQLDVLVYSAGLARGKDKVSVKQPYEAETVYQTVLIGLQRVLHHAIPALEQTEGHIFHVGSIAYRLNYPGGADYCASKAGANSILRTLRFELLGTGIRTTSLEVGLGNTNFQNARYDGDAEKAHRHTQGIRQLQPEDLAQVVSSILDLPEHCNVDEVVFKPLDQATHGVLVTKNDAF